MSKLSDGSLRISARKVEAQLPQADQNKDRQLDRDEFKNIKLPGVPSEKMDELYNRLNSASQDGSSGISRNDLNAAGETLADTKRRDALADNLQDRFDGFDTNRDNNISITEMRNGAKRDTESYNDFTNLRHQSADPESGISRNDLNTRIKSSVERSYFSSAERRSAIQYHIAGQLLQNFDRISYDGSIGVLQMANANLETPDGKPIPGSVNIDIMKKLSGQTDDGRLGVTMNDLKKFFEQD